jgi:glycosyltransferase involved in cell wall biosynthesis
MNADPHTPIRVLLISKACVVGVYQRKLEEIAAHPGIDLTAVVPPLWRDARGEIWLERAYTRGYNLVVEDMRLNGSFHLHHYPGLKRQVDAFRPHIVHIDEEPYNLATAHALALARRVGAQTLFFSWQNLLRRYPPPFSWLESWVLRRVDYGIAGNQEAVQVWRQKGYTGPLTVIPQFGVDPDIFSPAVCQEQPEHLTIGYAGRLVPEKGLDVLIKAVTMLPGKWALRILGDGPQLEELQTLAGLYNISGSISFEKPIPSTAMPGFYRQLDVLVLPSLTRPNWKEQFGRVLIEAMACGVPVIGSESGAIPEVVGDAGLLFPEGDAGALQAHLAAVIQYPRLRQQLAEAGRARVLASFTQAQIAARTVAVYRAMRGF